MYNFFISIDLDWFVILDLNRKIMVVVLFFVIRKVNRSVTSCYHGHDLSDSKQRTIRTNITKTALTSFFSGEPK